MIFYCFLLNTILCQSQNINTLSVCIDETGNRYLQGTSWTKEINGNLQRCSCLDGGNGQYSCEFTNENAFLIVADGPQIHRISLFQGDVYRKDCISNIPGQAVGVAADLNENKMYFSDVVHGHVGIYVTALDCSSRATRFISDDIHEPNGLAVDWLSKNVYWADAQHGAIFMADQFGNNRVRIISGLHDPRSVAVDPVAGALFWSDHADGTINFVRLDGEYDPALFGSENLQSKFLTLYEMGVWPNQIVIDPHEESSHINGDGSITTYNGMIYWIDGGKKTIERVDYLGFNYKLILDFQHMFKIDGSSVPSYGLALHNEQLFFSPWYQGVTTVYAVDREGGHLSQISRGISKRPFSMLVVHEHMQKAPSQTQGQRFCMKQNNSDKSVRHRCSHLCANVGLDDYVCLCPSNSGLVLGPDKATCVIPDQFLLVTSVEEGTVSLIPKAINGVQLKPDELHDRVVIATSERPSAVVYDPVDEFVYWSDVAFNRIYRKKLGQASHETVLEDLIGTVDGLAIDVDNRLLFFTNVLPMANGKSHARVESLSFVSYDRVLIGSWDLQYPRAIAVDPSQTVIYFTDWGRKPAIYRCDYQGKDFTEITALTEMSRLRLKNPNGLAVVMSQGTKKIFVVDAQYSDGDDFAYADPPSLTWIHSESKLSYAFDNYDIPPELIRVPFGVTAYGDQSWFTDWELEGIVQVDPNSFGRQSTIMRLKKNLKKPTGIFFVERVSAKARANPCLRHQCSHTCVPKESEYYCSCPKNTGLVIGTDGVQCVTPERFLLVADVNRILLQTLEDGYPGQTPGPVVLYESPNMFSNIAGVVFDPIEGYVYWSDNGVKHIARRQIYVNPPEDILDRDRVLLNYEIMPFIESMAEINALTLDVENRLLVWTDSGRGTVEILSLRPGAIFHATAAARRQKPMGVTLDATSGRIFWTEMGDDPGLWQMDFNGDNMKLVVPEAILPASIFFDSSRQEIILGDAKTVKMESYTSIDFAPVHELGYIDAEHLFSVTTDGESNFFSDWVKRSVHMVSRDVSRGSTIIGNLIRPTQIFFNSGLDMADNGICMTNDVKCSHICLPADDGYDCACPDNLYMAGNYQTCVAQWDETFKFTTLAPITEEVTSPQTTEGTTTTVIYITEPNVVYSAYDDNETVYDYDIAAYDYDLVEEAPIVTQPPLANSTAESVVTVTVVETTTEATKVETTETTTTTAKIVIEFTNCPRYAENSIELHLDSGYTFSTIDNSKFNLTANAGGVELDVVRTKATPKKLKAGKKQVVEFEAYDSISNTTVNCAFQIDIIDTEPPRVLFCPSEMKVSSFRKDLTSYVEWPMPEWDDNLGASNLNITMSHEPGFFPIGIHEILITATDEFGNSATCGFEVMVKQDRPKMGCGYPPKPPNSELMCQTDSVNFIQNCKVFCSDGFENALYLPEITCNFTSILQEEHTWLPALDANVCQKPAIAGASKTVQLTYNAPCIPDPSFYKSSIAVMKPQIQSQPRCATKARARFCEKPESFLQIECENGEKIRLNITVEIGETESMKTTATVLSYLDLVVEDIRVAAVNGSLTLKGSDKEDYIAKKAEELPSYSAFSSSLVLSQLICEDGHKVVKEGCLKCPKGSRLLGNECVLCRIGEYQEIPGTSKCFSCPAGKTTVSVGTTSIFKCVDAPTESSSLLPFIIAGCAAGFIILLALVLCVVCVMHKKKRQRQRQHLEAVQRHARNERAEQEKAEQLAQLEREREAREAEFARQRAERRAMMNALSVEQENQEPIPVENESDKSSSDEEDDDMAKPSQVESESGEDNEDDLDAEVANTFQKAAAEKDEPKSILRKVSKYEKGQTPSTSRMGLQSSLSMRSTHLPTASALNQMSSSGVVRHASIAGSMTGSQMMMMPVPPNGVQRTPSMNIESFNQQMMLQKMMTQGNYDMVRPAHPYSPAIATPPDSTYDVPRPSYPGSHVGSFVGSQVMAPPPHSQMSNMPPPQMAPPMSNPHQRQGSFQGGFPDHAQMPNFNQPHFMEGPPHGQVPNGFGPPGPQLPPHMQGAPGHHQGPPGQEQYDNMQFNNMAPPPFNMGPGHGQQGFY